MLAHASLPFEKYRYDVNYRYHVDYIADPHLLSYGSQSFPSDRILEKTHATSGCAL